MSGSSVQNIVFAFLQTYYQRMSKDPSKVSSLYSLTAELTHINYQVEFDVNAETLPTIKLIGKENISKFFTRNNKKVSDLKVLVESCDFQTAGTSHSSIVILTTGEMFWTGTPTYRFVQTIILTPNPSTKDSFDVTNDLIRFLPDNLSPYVFETKDFSGNNNLKSSEKNSHSETLEKRDPKEMEISDQNGSSGEPKDVEEKRPIQRNSSECEKMETNINEDIKNITIGETEDKKKYEMPAEAPVKVKSDTKLDVQKEEQITKGENDKVSNEMKTNASEVRQTNEETPTASAAPVRMSWASKLAANAEISKSTAQGPPTVETVKTESQSLGNRKANEIKAEDLPNRKDSPNIRTIKKKAPQFSTINRDGFYPIYIKRTTGLTEDKLKSVLESEFGTVMKMTVSDSFAVVDFETQKSQTEALERKQLTIGDNEICFNRKTVKKPTSPPIGPSTSLRSHKKHINNNNTSNNNNNGNGKRKD